MPKPTACFETPADGRLLSMRILEDGAPDDGFAIRSTQVSSPPHAEEARSAVSKHANRLCRRIVSAIVFSVLLWGFPAFAVNPGEQLTDPAKEARARALGAELRCMVCQNQSIDDSDAPLAKDLRVLVRERVQAGDSDGEVLDFLVARYGEFVLLRPRLRGETLLLWGLAPAVLGLGLAGYVLWARRARRRPQKAEGLSEDERARLETLLAQPDGVRSDGPRRLT